jgi:hypothetical protein
MSDTKIIEELDKLIAESEEIHNSLDNDDEMTKEQIIEGLKKQMELLDKTEKLQQKGGE